MVTFEGGSICLGGFRFTIFDLRFGFWVLGFGIWNLEFEIWNLDLGILAFAPSPSPSTRLHPIQTPLHPLVRSSRIVHAEAVAALLVYMEFGWNFVFSQTLVE